MMGLSEIDAASREWATRANEELRRPLVFYDKTDVHPPWQFPKLGGYIPPGWVYEEDLFCDSSGLGSSDEPALNTEQLTAKILSYLKMDYITFGFGIVSAGQFQLTLRVFKQVPMRTVTSKSRKKKRK